MEYDYIDKERGFLKTTYHHSRESSTADSDSESIYWNDSLVGIRAPLHSISSKYKSLQKSQSSQELCREGSREYEVRLPRFDPKKLSTRWSLSSEEGEEQSGGGGGGGSVGCLVAGTPKSSITYQKTSSDIGWRKNFSDMALNLKTRCDLHRSSSSPYIGNEGRNHASHDNSHLEYSTITSKPRHTLLESHHRKKSTPVSDESPFELIASIKRSEENLYNIQTSQGKIEKADSTVGTENVSQKSTSPCDVTASMDSDMEPLYCNLDVLERENTPDNLMPQVHHEPSANTPLASKKSDLKHSYYNIEFIDEANMKRNSTEEHLKESTIVTPTTQQLAKGRSYYNLEIEDPQALPDSTNNSPSNGKNEALIHSYYNLEVINLQAHLSGTASSSDDQASCNNHNDSISSVDGQQSRLAHGRQTPNQTAETSRENAHTSPSSSERGFQSEIQAEQSHHDEEKTVNEPLYSNLQQLNFEVSGSSQERDSLSASYPAKPEEHGYYNLPELYRISPEALNSTTPTAKKIRKTVPLSSKGKKPIPVARKGTQSVRIIDKSSTNTNASPPISPRRLPDADRRGRGNPPKLAAKPLWMTTNFSPTKTTAKPPANAQRSEATHPKVHQQIYKSSQQESPRSSTPQALLEKPHTPLMRSISAENMSTKPPN